MKFLEGVVLLHSYADPDLPKKSDDFSLEDKEYLKAHYYDEAPADEEEERREGIDNRLVELGYAPAKWD